ncbi:MAG: HNH endonuclease [Dysgonamonadaceae bacterium]|jgi:hypothetical protein|nr:HNH endonuclease [Dysgonamonadaceae bacterium]
MEDKYETLTLSNGQKHHLQWVYTSNYTVELIYLSEWDDNSKYPKLELCCLEKFNKEDNGEISKFLCIKNQPIQKNGRLVLRHWLLEAEAPESGIVTIVDDFSFDHALTTDLTRRLKTGDVILKIDFSEGAIKEYSKIQEEKASHQKIVNEENEKREIKEKLLESQRKKNLKKQALQELIEEGLIFNERKNNENSREPIPQDVRDRVWNRDGGKCVVCGSQHNLEFDHIIPFSKGGATTYRNLQLLCENCNRKKSNQIG